MEIFIILSIVDVKDYATTAEFSGIGSITRENVLKCTNIPILENILIGEGITGIGTNSFISMTTILKVAIPKSIEKIETSAFEGCSNLANLGSFEFCDKLGGFDANCFKGTSLLNYVLYVPKSCSYIIGGSFTSTKVKEMVFLNEVTLKIGALFISGNKYLTSLYLNTSIILDSETFQGPPLKTVFLGPLVSILANPFPTCTTIETIQLISTHSYLSIQNGREIYSNNKKEIYFYPSQVTTPYIAPAETETIKRGAFYGSYITEADLSSVITVDYIAFVYCKLIKVKFEKIKTISSRAFESANSLESVVLPEGLEVLGLSAFSGCSTLKQINFPSTLIDIGGLPLGGCSNLTEVDVHPLCGVVYLDPETKILYKADFSSFIFIPASETVVKINENMLIIPQSALLNMKTIKNIIFMGQVTNIHYQAFYLCTGLINITFPKSLKTMGGRTCNSCTSLEKVIFEEGCQVQKIETSDFQNCVSLKEIVFGNIPLHTIGKDAFNLCKSIKILDLPASLTTIENGAFSACSQLYELTIKSEKALQISSSAFNDCNKLEILNLDTKIVSPLSFNNLLGFKKLLFSDIIEEIGASAFSGCSNLISITFPSELKCRSLVLNNNAFAFCTSIHEMILPKQTINLTGNIFTGCSSLISIKVQNEEKYETMDGVLYEKGKETLIVCPAGLKECYVSNLTKILGKHSFSGCLNLETIYLSFGLTNILDFCFYNCKKLKEINIPLSIKYFGENPFYGCELLSTIYYCGLSDLDMKTFEDKDPFPEKTLFWVSNLYHGVNENEFLNKKISITNSIDQYKCPLIPSGQFTYLHQKSKKLSQTALTLLFTCLYLR